VGARQLDELSASFGVEAVGKGARTETGEVVAAAADLRRAGSTGSSSRPMVTTIDELCAAGVSGSATPTRSSS